MTVTNTLLRLLVLAVIFVNGWTDAPNAIATAVGSGALTFRRAVRLAALCNFAGAAVSCSLLPTVAATVGELVTFADGQAALNALCAAMLSIILWAAAAWRFGLPTSESHALLAGLSGAALALGSADLNSTAWLKTIGGMLILLDWRMFLCMLAVFIILLVTTKYMSIASLSTTITGPLSAFVLRRFVDQLPAPQVWMYVGTVFFFGLLLVFTHRENIKRLINGTENRLGKKKKDA